MADATRTRDAWLAMRCQLGETAAFRELVAEMEGPLLYFASKLLGNERDAPDVLQDVWAQAFAKIRNLRDPESLRAWLYRLTRAIAVGRIRSDVARERREAALSGEAPLGDDDTDARIANENAATLHRALDALSLSHREVLTLHFLEELPLEEIAEIVDVPAGTIKSRLFYAKRCLREVLESADAKPQS
jgi:RNA polymerase sigma-70 factor (ECF subfamily)